MPRILVVLSLFVLGLAPSAVYSLGLGDIDLRSALNQPFLAEIAVTSDSASDLTGLKVELASADTFRQFGLDRAGFLEGFKFEVTQRPGGAAVRIRSTQPVVEPFVTLLLEVQWPQGRLLREYTVLLDPPVFAEQSVQPSMAAPVSGPAPAPSRVTRPPEQPRSAAPAPVARPPVRSVPQLPANGDFREVRRNDTLWGIAGELQGLDPSLNRNQLMIAIYRANPDAFAGNINRLKAGVILRVPDAGQLAAESARAANAEVARQNEAWRGAAAASQSARLRLVPPPEGDSAEQTAGGAESTGTGTGSADAQALRQRIGELESQLEDNERLIEVRDQELQNLQRRLAELQGVEAPSSELQSELIDEVADEVAADEIAEPVGDEAADAETAAVAPEPEPEPEPAAAPAVRPDQVVTTQQPEDKSFIGGLFSSIWFYIALALAAMVGLFALRRRQSESPAGRWESLQPDEDDLGQETHEATTRMRAKKPQSESFVVEEVPAGSGTDDVSAYAPATGGLDLGGAPDEQETPFERTISSDVAVNLDQADPIAEAEFHMAYGLYDQAADLLSKALQSEPERKDYRLKLLEVYFIWENQSGFLDEARNFQANVETASDPDWNKVLIMGKQICPDEAMFADAPSAAGDVGEMDLAFGEDSPNVVDLSFDESPEDSLDIDLSTGSQPADPDVLEFDLGGDAESTESPTVETPTVETDMSDSPTMETPTVESPAVASTMETPTIESPGLGASTMETPTIESPGLGASTMETPTIESPAMSATMEAPTVETPSGDWDDKTEIASRVEQTAEIELDDLGLDLSDLDDAGDEYAADDTGELSPGDFSDMANDESMIMKAGGAGLDTTGAFDLGGGEIDDADARGVLDVDSTAEMQGLESGGGDTAEQPFGSDTAEQPGPDVIGSDALAAGLLEDADFDDATAGSDDVTMEMPSSESQADGPTMTEVGTKLDLARAYIDMGDPDGARSILNEVLEEAGESQRQEARKLLDDLGDA